MNRASVVRALLLWGLFSLAAVGQEQVPGAAAPEGTETPPDATPEAEEASDDIFIPSEELSADEEVTFPVDI